MKRAAVFTLLVAGCMGLGRQPDASKFFTLTPVAEDAAGPAVGGEGKLSVGLGPILLPGYLVRTQLVRRVGPNEIKLAESDRWAEPLGEAFGRTLRQNLVHLLGADRVVVYPWPIATRVDLRVSVEVLRFEPGTDGSAELAARWTVREGTGADVIAARDSDLREPASGGDTAAAVGAMSRALSRLSGEIAQVIAQR